VKLTVVCPWPPTTGAMLFRKKIELVGAHAAEPLSVATCVDCAFPFLSV
jgi:hypothetical protein